MNSRDTVYPRNMVCFRYIIVCILHKGDDIVIIIIIIIIIIIAIVTITII
jgi:hypothetical protein